MISIFESSRRVAPNASFFFCRATEQVANLLAVNKPLARKDHIFNKKINTLLLQPRRKLPDQIVAQNTSP